MRTILSARGQGAICAMLFWGATHTAIAQPSRPLSGESPAQELPEIFSPRKPRSSTGPLEPIRAAPPMQSNTTRPPDRHGAYLGKFPESAQSGHEAAAAARIPSTNRAAGARQ